MKLEAEKIGKRIKSRQTELGYKQKEIIEKTGISKAAISNYIGGNRIPDTEAILKLSLTLNTTIEWLLTGKSTNENLTKEEKELIQAYRIASENAKEIIHVALKPYMDQEKSSDSAIG